MSPGHVGQKWQLNLQLNHINVIINLQLNLKMQNFQIFPFEIGFAKNYSEFSSF